MKFLVLFVLSAGFLYSQVSEKIKLRDGRVFDKGFELTEPSPNAPKELNKLADLLGEWNVKINYRTSDSTFHESDGYARFTYLNRGYSIMEKFYCSDFNGKGNELNTLSFIVYNSQNKLWNIGLANSFKENITTYSGEDSDGGLILYNSLRQNGWINLFTYKYSIKNISKNSFTVTIESSINSSGNWKLIQENEYKRAENGLNVIFENDDYGSCNSELPKEARQFDFLIGEWDAHHELLAGDGNYVKFNSNATAVYAMNGNAIMEHDWFDAKRGIKDPGTSLIRIYNRAMRRWECLFLTNRANANYYFGGVKEGDKIVLHSFNTDSGAPQYSYFTFYNISKDDYSWYGERTNDKGKTFTKTWIIEVDKKKGE